MIYLHTNGHGEIWRGDAHEIMPTRFTDPWQYVEAYGEENAYVLGTKRNSELVTCLFGAGRRVYLGTPALCGRPALANDPEFCWHVMQSMHSMLDSCGGYHRMCQDDAIVYGMCTTQATLGVLVSKHSLWPHLGFVHGGATEAVASLMATILDPRWYIDLNKPSSLASIMAWLGLDPYTQRGVLGLGPKGRHHARCALVLRAWWPRELCALDASIGQGQTVLPCDVTYHRPGAFAYREWVRRYLASTRETVVKSVLAASKRFVRYVWYGWRATQSDAHPELVFCPRNFFRDVSHVAAYRAWVGR